MLVLAGCGTDGPETPPDPPGDPSVEGTPVQGFETSTCSTGVVLALSRQISEEVNCLLPGQLVRFEAQAGIELTSDGVLPYLGERARADLHAAAAAGGGKVVRINSAFRTVVQQYLLRRWFELGRCGITAAAEPGESNHESGRHSSRQLQ